MSSDGGKKTKSVGFISIDWEARGKDLVRHGVCGVGLVLFDQSGSVIRSYGSGIAATDGQQFEPKTKEEFWDKNPEALAWCEQNAKPPMEVANEIVAFYHDAKKQFGEIKWVAWPSGYDGALLLFFLTTFYPGEYPIEEHSPVCVSAMADSYRLVAWLENKPKATDLGGANLNPHNPVSDAEVQGKAYFALQDKLKGFSPSHNPELRRKIVKAPST